MSSRRTSLSRENPTFSGISRALFDYCSSKQSMDEPIGQPATAVADQAFAIDPVAPAARILDAIIIAQPRRRRLSPPFGRDPLRSRDARNVMDRASPDEAARHAFRGRIDDIDGLGAIEHALGADDW